MRYLVLLVAILVLMSVVSCRSVETNGASASAEPEAVAGNVVASPASQWASSLVRWRVSATNEGDGELVGRSATASAHDGLAVIVDRVRHDNELVVSQYVVDIDADGTVEEVLESVELYRVSGDEYELYRRLADELCAACDGISVRPLEIVGNIVVHSNYECDRYIVVDSVAAINVMINRAAFPGFEAYIESRIARSIAKSELSRISYQTVRQNCGQIEGALLDVFDELQMAAAQAE